MIEKWDKPIKQKITFEYASKENVKSWKMNVYGTYNTFIA